MPEQAILTLGQHLFGDMTEQRTVSMDVGVTAGKAVSHVLVSTEAPGIIPSPTFAHL